MLLSKKNSENVGNGRKIHVGEREDERFCRLDKCDNWDIWAFSAMDELKSKFTQKINIENQKVRHALSKPSCLHLVSIDACTLQASHRARCKIEVMQGEGWKSSYTTV